jgi:RimJ/RimL family protein N-acetyltransferase
MDEDIFLETGRLILRRFTSDDVDRLAALDADPEVMRYIADGRTRTRSDVEEGVARVLLNYEKYPGLGVWIAAEKPGLDFAGWFALKYIPGTEEVEVGYRLRKSAWGRGLATEGALALLRYGFGARGLDRIVAVTHPANAASQRVLRKLGLEYRGVGRYYGRELSYFVIEREEFPAP